MYADLFSALNPVVAIQNGEIDRIIPSCIRDERVPQLSIHLLYRTPHAPLLLALIVKWNKQDSGLAVFFEKANPKAPLCHAVRVHPRIDHNTS
jgi:hypothetical protein